MNNGPQLLMTEPVGFEATTSVPAVPKSIWYAYHPTILTDSSGILEMLCWEASTNEVLIGSQKRSTVLYNSGCDPNGTGG